MASGASVDSPPRCGRLHPRGGRMFGNKRTHDQVGKIETEKRLGGVILTLERHFYNGSGRQSVLRAGGCFAVILASSLYVTPAFYPSFTAGVWRQICIYASTEYVCRPLRLRLPVKRRPIRNGNQSQNPPGRRTTEVKALPLGTLHKRICRARCSTICRGFAIRSCTN